MVTGKRQPRCGLRGALCAAMGSVGILTLLGLKHRVWRPMLINRQCVVSLGTCTLQAVCRWLCRWLQGSTTEPPT